MSSDSFAAAPTRFWSNLTIAVFMMALVLPGILTLTQNQATVSLTENRTLAAQPVYTGQPLKTLFEEIENYVNDHFGLRETFIFWNQFLEVMVLGQSTNPQVVIGQDGWLFLMDPLIAADFQGLRTFTPEQLDIWKTRLEQRRDWFAEYGIDYFFALAPEKQTIYPEFVPASYRRFGPMLHDQLMTYMAENSTFEITDLRSTILSHKDEGPLYYQYDSHWNQLGVYYGYTAIADHLQRLLPEVEPVSIDTVPVTSIPLVYEDLGRLLGLPEYFHDEGRLHPASRCSMTSEMALPETRGGSIRASIYRCEATSLRLLIFGDSFSLPLAPILAENFAEAVFLYRHLDLVGPENLRTLLDTYQPDVVIEEAAERSLVRSLPRPIQ